MFRKLIVVLFIGIVFVGHAQDKPQAVPTAYTLQEAVNYALTNSPLIKNANLDLEIAKKKIWETTAMGLPQVNSKLAYSYMLTVPESIKSFSSLSQLGSWMNMVNGAMSKMDSTWPIPAQPMTPTEATEDKDLRWGMTYDVTVSQLVFSGAYLVGLQTSKIYKQLSELAINKNKNDIESQVINTYYLVLIAKDNKALLDSTYINTENLLTQITAMYEQGMLEETDVDQMKLAVSTLGNARAMLERQLEIAMNLLKFQMGLPLESAIELTDLLPQMLASTDFASIMLKEFSVQSNVDYKLLDTQEKLAGMNLKLQKSMFLPDVVAFYNHQENFNDKSFSFTPPNMIGFNVSIPIFGSGLKLAKVKQAQLGLEKMAITKQQASNGLAMQFSDSQAQYKTAYANYLNAQENMKLSKKIYDKTVIKYKEGVSGSMDLTQTRNQFLDMQSKYYLAVMQLINTKVKLESLIK